MFNVVQVRQASGVSLGLVLALGLLAGCARSPQPGYQGYLEGEFVFASAPLPGTLTQLAVARGQSVNRGDLLFGLEAAAEQAALNEATNRLAQARARLDDLNKGRRPTEIAALEARLAQARASLRLSEAEFARREQLHRDNVISAEELDLAKARRDADQAQSDALAAELATAKLGGREDAVRAAEAEAQTAEAALTLARWAVEQKQQTAPAAGLVQDTVYRVGEFVPAGNPVVVLLPPENIRVRFFVPQADLASIQPGKQVSVCLDGWSQPLTAVVNYISPQNEFTPPVLFNREMRSKLVYMIEAKFSGDDARQLHPGQPVEVRWQP